MHDTRTVELILLSRLGGPDFALNPDLIERAEATPDTVITLVSGNKYVVRQSLEEVIELITRNRAEIIVTAEHLGSHSRSTLETATRSHRFSAQTRDSVMPSVVPLHPQEG